MKSTIIATIILCTMIASCEWLDNQTEALNCCKDGINIGDVKCEDRKFWLCDSSCRWHIKLTCEELKDLETCVECCNE